MAVTFSLSPGQAHDATEGRALLERLGPPNRPLHLLMDRAYEGNETRQLALDLGFIPVVPPKSTRIQPWEYDRAMYRRRNEVERLFRRLKGYRRIFSRFEKLRRHRCARVLQLLRTVETNVPPALDIHSAMDNYGTHKTASIENWLARAPQNPGHGPTGSCSGMNRGTLAPNRHILQAVRLSCARHVNAIADHAAFAAASRSQTSLRVDTVARHRKRVE